MTIRTPVEETATSSAIDGDEASLRKKAQEIPSPSDMLEEIDLKPASTTKENENVDEVLLEEWPSEFYCHKTRVLMTDPVVGPDGNSFEKSSTEQEGNDDSAAYYPNRALQAIIQESLALRSARIRASLRQFQQSVSHGLSHILPESAANEPIFRPLNKPALARNTTANLSSPFSQSWLLYTINVARRVLQSAAVRRKCIDKALLIPAILNPELP